jgi:glycosyltransferase involved in cell wall biosynthesis
MTMSDLRYSIVLPVWNEANNIATLCGKLLEELPPGYELLICYDMDEDTTLAALAAVPALAKPDLIRLVKNDLGKGVRYAIEAGMRAAAAPVVLVVMADLSDELSRVEEVISHIENGTDVVCGTRYSLGGKQVGGPLVKKTLSRLAGHSLHYLAGLPTHDPTNSFKAYSKAYLERTQIESTAGFSLGLELTVKAHFSGGRVTEVPTTWYDRTSGESRFPLRKWLPQYLRWYFYAFRERGRQLVER